MGNEDMVQDAQKEEQDRELLEQWKPVWEADKSAKRAWDRRFDDWESIYDAGREFLNVLDQSNTDNRTPRTIINFPRMIIESLIDLAIPDPDFKAVSQDDEQPVEVLKNYVMYVVRSATPSLEEINLHNERRVMKFGGAFWKIHWNNNAKRAGYVGEIEISKPHPKDIIPNHGASGVDDMEHYHHPNNRTVNYITRKWPHITREMLENKAAIFKEFDELTGSQRINVNDTQSGDEDMGLNKYTVIETTYRDEDNDICKLWWSGDLVIQHTPKFYYRRGEDSKTTTAHKAKLNENGSLVSDDEGDIDLEYYVPKSWDLIYQPFIPRDKCFWGISIMEDIHDINEAIKKAVYQQEEQYLKGTKKILVSDPSIKIKLESSISSVEVVNDPNMNVREIDLFSNIDGIGWIEKLKEWMQLLTGATNAALGVNDANVNSAKQAQVYVEQANFKVQLKTAYKAVAYKRIYRTIADFALAFVDEARPYRIEGAPPVDPANPAVQQPKAQYGKFDRLAMLKDQAGNYIYPDFDIEIGAEAGFMKSKGEIFNTLSTLAGQGRFEPNPGNLAFIKVLSKLGVPNLQGIIDEMSQNIQQAQQPQPEQQPQQPQAKGPSESMSFKDLPPAGQIQMAAKAGIQLQPQDVQAIAAQLPTPQEPQQPQPEQPQQDIVSQVLAQLPPDKRQAFLSLPEEQQQALIQQVMGGANNG